MHFLIFNFFLAHVNYVSAVAMQKVLDNLKELPPSTGAKDIDLIFLRGIMESPIVRSLAKVPKTLSVCLVLLISDSLMCICL